MVDGMVTELKTLRVDPHTAVKNALGRGRSQARHVVIDGRNHGLNEADARRGLARFLGGAFADRLDSIRVFGTAFGTAFDILWEREER